MYDVEYMIFIIILSILLITSLLISITSFLIMKDEGQTSEMMTKANKMCRCSSCNKLFRVWESRSIKARKSVGHDYHEIDKLSYLSSDQILYYGYKFQCPQCGSFNIESVSSILKDEEHDKLDKLYKTNKLDKHSMKKIIKIEKIKDEEMKNQRIYELIKDDMESYKNLKEFKNKEDN